MMFIGPRHSSGAHDSRAPLGRLVTSDEWRAPMRRVFSRGEGVPGFVDSWAKTLVPSESKRSTPSGLLWTPGRADSTNGKSAPAHPLLPDPPAAARQTERAPHRVDPVDHRLLHADLAAPFAGRLARPLVGGVEADLGAEPAHRAREVEIVDRRVL